MPTEFPSGESSGRRPFFRVLCCFGRRQLFCVLRKLVGGGPADPFVSGVILTLKMDPFCVVLGVFLGCVFSVFVVLMLFCVVLVLFWWLF